MGKKTIGKKGDERKKYEDDVSDRENESCTNVEDDVEDKEKKRQEIGVVELSAGKSDVVLEDGVDEDKKKKKKKKKKGCEVGVELSESRIPCVKESDVKGEKKENEEVLESGGNDAGFGDNQSKAVMDSDVHRDKKKKKKKNKKMDEVSVNEAVTEGDVDRNSIENEKDKKKKKKKRKIEEFVEGQTNQEEQDSAETMKGEKSDQRKKKKQRKREKEGGDAIVMNKVTHGEDKSEREQLDGDIVEKVEISGKEKKRKRKKHINAVGDVNSEVNDKNIRDNESNDASGRNIEGHVVVGEDSNKEKKKKSKSVKDHSKGGSKKVPRTKKGAPSENSSQKESSKKVSFSDQVEVFTLSDAKNSEDGLVRGKRFSREEDEIVKEAVLNYIESHELGEEGLNMVLHCRSHPEVRNCWKEIGAALPWRPYVAVYYRAHILFERAENRKWTPEEIELIRKFHEKHGSSWKMLAEALGKHRFHVKDTWRRIRLPNRRKGQWNQEEYQKLFDLVNMDLRMKASEERKSKHGMLRDNISWEAICDKLETRSGPVCCVKWYDQLTSPLVVEGKWRDTDDYHMVIALSNLDACCIEDVDWDNLLEDRSGVICRKRWNQMIKHLGPDRNKSFAEQVEILSSRYCPDVLEAREAYNSKPAVD
ncbi:hypothetical protein Pint_11826 [Pistacia integerrima]|uniref:Uncharacterized protein n=1 Tax=Pistacia integerrima TaxID=434235 RepID=A0ACC0XI59_9ROSI|nr:hypothetical protein Pint_11826 [Pistacia integerrima]